MANSNVSGTEFAAISLAVAQGMGAWVALVPSLKVMTDGDIDNDKFRIEVRNRECIVAGITIACGALGSWLLQSKAPIVASLIIIAALATGYEVALRLDTGELESPFSHTTKVEDTDNAG